MQQTGCGVCLDDFGTGFSSFAYLKHLHVDSIKIDGLFIRGLSKEPDNQLFVKAMVSVARDLRKTTIVECVEDEETLQMLATFGVDCVQGYHLELPQSSSPMIETALGMHQTLDLPFKAWPAPRGGEYSLLFKGLRCNNSVKTSAYDKGLVMPRMVKCIKLGREAEGLDFAPYPGELGKRIFDNVSKEAWKIWLEQQKMLVNENRLSLADKKSRDYLAQQMDKHFFGGGADAAAGYVPPEKK